MKIKSLLSKSLYGFAALTIVAGSLMFKPEIAQAMGECASGYYPKTTGIVENGDFTTSPTDVYPTGHPGNTNVTPGYYYANAKYYSQMANAGYDIYPSDAGGYNVFSVQTGSYSAPPIDQVPFPGDPTYNISGTNNWLYTNGNMLNGGEYLTWEQDVSGLTAGTQYVFVVYISNVVEPTGFPDDPTIRLRVGGTTGMPDGTVIHGPVVLTEADTANSTTNNGWQRVAYSFTATGSTEKLKITDASTGTWGDDFAMTAIGLSECTLAPDYSASISHGSTPSQYGSHNLTATFRHVSGVADGGHTATITLPAGYTVNGGNAGSLILTANTGSYTCNSNAVSPQVVTCSTPNAIPNAGSYSVGFDVAVGNTAAANAVVTAAVNVPFDEVTGNNTASDTIALMPDLSNVISVNSSDANSVTVQTTIKNVGTYKTAGNDQVAITLPDGVWINGGAAGSVTPTGANASEWNCTSDAASPQVVTCTHAGIIRNLPVDDQTFLLSFGIKPGAAAKQVAFASAVTSSGDTNSGNNSSNVDFTLGETVKSPQQQKLEDTGKTLGACLVALLFIGLAIFTYKKKGSRLYRARI